MLAAAADRPTLGPKAARRRPAGREGPGPLRGRRPLRSDEAPRKPAAPPLRCRQMTPKTSGARAQVFRALGLADQPADVGRIRNDISVASQERLEDAWPMLDQQPAATGARRGASSCNLPSAATAWCLLTAPVSGLDYERDTKKPSDFSLDTRAGLSVGPRGAAIPRRARAAGLHTTDSRLG